MKQSDGEILKKSIRQHFKSVEQAAVLLKKTRRQIYYYFEQDEIDCQKCQEKNIMNVAPGANPKYEKVKKLVELLDIDLVTNVPRITFREQLKNKKVETKEFRVPLVTIKARAGYLSSYENIDLINSLDKYAIPPGVSYTGAIWRYFEVDGDSMEPALQRGDYVLCSPKGIVGCLLCRQGICKNNKQAFFCYTLNFEIFHPFFLAAALFTSTHPLQFRQLAAQYFLSKYFAPIRPAL